MQEQGRQSRLSSLCSRFQIILQQFSPWQSGFISVKPVRMWSFEKAERRTRTGGLNVEQLGCSLIFLCSQDDFCLFVEPDLFLPKHLDSEGKETRGVLALGGPLTLIIPLRKSSWTGSLLPRVQALGIVFKACKLLLTLLSFDCV